MLVSSCGPLRHSSSLSVSSAPFVSGEDVVGSSAEGRMIGGSYLGRSSMAWTASSVRIFVESVVLALAWALSKAM